MTCKWNINSSIPNRKWNYWIFILRPNLYVWLGNVNSNLGLHCHFAYYIFISLWLILCHVSFLTMGFCCEVQHVSMCQIYRLSRSHFPLSAHLPYPVHENQSPLTLPLGPRHFVFFPIYRLRAVYRHRIISAHTKRTTSRPWRDIGWIWQKVYEKKIEEMSLIS